MFNNGFVSSLDNVLCECEVAILGNFDIVNIP